MKTILLVLFTFPIFVSAQRAMPRFVNDTLYTTSGYKIYVGQTLHFGKGTKRNGKFRYINIKSETAATSLANNSIIVKDLKNFGISQLGNGYIEIIGSIVFKDGSKGSVDIHMAFDHAIENSPDLPSELIVPDEFRNKSTGSTADEISKLNKLYQDGILTKEEFESQKKKLLEKQ